MAAPSAIVIGAGITGLSAARALIAAGVTNTLVLESSARAGGVIASCREGEFLFEQGPDSFLACKPAALALCRELGLEARLLGSCNAGRKTWIWRRGKLAALPAGWQFLAPSRFTPLLVSPLIGLGAKLRLAREWWAAAEPEGEDESVANWVRRRFGAEVLEAMAAPMLAGVYGGDAEELSLAAALPRFAALARQGSVSRALWRDRRAAHARAQAPAFLTLRGGMEELVAALAASIGSERLRFGFRAAFIEAEGGGYRVRGADGASLAAPVLIVAAPAPAAAQLLRGLDLELANELAAVTYASSMTVNLAYAPAPPLPAGTGALMARDESIRMLACTFMHRKFPARAPAGTALLRLFYGGRRDEAILARSDDDVLALARRELRLLFGIEAQPVAALVSRWPAAMAQPALGHLARLRRIEAALTRHSRLALAGNAYGGVGIGDCIASGQHAAARVARGYV